MKEQITIKYIKERLKSDVGTLSDNLHVEIIDGVSFSPVLTHKDKVVVGEIWDGFKKKCNQCRTLNFKTNYHTYDQVAQSWIFVRNCETCAKEKK